MKLVKNAKQAWKWFSVQSLVLCTALQGAWVFVPADLKVALPDWAFNTLCAAILILGVIGRLVDQEESDA